MESFKGFPYERCLQANEIRILTLHPGMFNEPISCSLHYDSLQKDHLYEALSYVWGKPEETTLIHVDGKDFPATSNLAKALNYLRYPDRERIMWVDAICISQKDGNERSQQVQTMRSIYAKAKEVLIWLGEISSNFREALALIPRIVELAERNERADTRRTAWLSNDIPDDFPNPSDPVWHNIFQLLARPWFRRAWTVQEFTMAQKATMIYGHLSVDAEHMLKAIRFLALSRDVFGNNIGNFQYTNRFDAITQHKRYLDGGIEMPPLQVFLRNRLAMATDPRDKIFAFYGMFKRDSIAALLSYPDYNAKCSDVYTQVAMGILKHSYNLDIFTASNVSDSTKSEISGLPSWVPDWSASDLGEPLLWKNIEHDMPILAKQDYRAAGNSSCYPIFREDNTKLCLKGYIIDTIYCLGPSFEPTGYEGSDEHNEQVAKAHQKHWMAWEKVAFTAVPGYARDKHPVTNEDISEAYWQTMIGGCTEFNKEVSRQTFYVWWCKGHPMRILLEKYPAHEVTAEKMLTMCDWVWYQLLPPQWLQIVKYQAASFLNAFRVLSSVGVGRRVIKTDHGMLGLAPRHSQMGDSVVLCQGGKLPLVIRATFRRDSDGKVIKEWKLIGEIYLHGRMDGKLWNQLRASQPLDDIVLV